MNDLGSHHAFIQERICEPALDGRWLSAPHGEILRYAHGGAGHLSMVACGSHSHTW